MNMDQFGFLAENCSNYTINEFNLQAVSEKLFVLNLNICSFDAKYDAFITFLDQLKFLPDIIIMSETWLNDEKQQNIVGYQSFHCYRDLNRSGGGISAFVNNSLNAKCFLISSENSHDLEHLHIKLLSNELKCDLIAVYRPPNQGTIDDFLFKIDEMLSNIPSSQKIILGGDLNINLLSDYSGSQKLIELSQIYSLSPHITLPTRPNSNGNDSLIDHIWSNFNDSNHKSGVFENIGLSDHLINFVFFHVSMSRIKTKVKFRNHSEVCINNMIDKLQNFSLFFPLLTATLDFDDKFSLFLDEIDRIYKASCHKLVISPWLFNRVHSMYFVT